MKSLLFSTAAAMLMVSAPASADNHSDIKKDNFSANSFTNLAYVFKTADLNSDGLLSQIEYDMYRTHTADKNSIATYSTDARAEMLPTIQRDFAALDTDNDMWISRTEFMNKANNPVAKKEMTEGKTPSADPAVTSYAPDYMTITYFLTATPIAADYFEGRKVVNLKGDTVGEIEKIFRVTEGDMAGEYVMLDIEGPDYYRYPGVEREKVGIALDDLLLMDRGESIMLSTKGESTLRDTDAPEIDVTKTEDVDTLFRLS